MGAGKEAGTMTTFYRATSRRERRRRSRLRVWNRIVMVIGYIAIVYELARLIIYLYLTLAGETWTII